MKTIQKLILSLLLLCQVLLGQLAYADTLKPIDIFNNPNLLADQWLTEPVPLSSYTEEEKRLQRLINDKTATAVQTYSTKAQDKEWTKYDHDEITPYTWKVLELDLTESNGKTFATSLLRPNWWIRNIGADRKGNRFYLKIPDVVEGWAVVKNIRVNQLDTRLWDEARKGDFVYRPVTATFQHDSNNLQQLYFTGNDTPLEVTPEHPIYSIDRNDFVHAGSLSIGEQVKTRQGITTLEQRKQLAGTHRVYNLEVYRDHNFMVSMDSILVHNSQDKGSYGGTRYNNPQKHREYLAQQAGIPRSLETNPANIWGANTSKVKQSFEMDGATLTRREPNSKQSGKADYYDIKDHPVYKEVEIHPGGGSGHNSSNYYKLVKHDGTQIRVIDPNKPYNPKTIAPHQIYLNPQGKEITYINKKWVLK